MTKRPRRNHTPAFKAKVALEAIKEEQTVIEIAERQNSNRPYLSHALDLVPASVNSGTL